MEFLNAFLIMFQTFSFLIFVLYRHLINSMKKNISLWWLEQSIIMIHNEVHFTQSIRSKCHPKSTFLTINFVLFLFQSFPHLLFDAASCPLNFLHYIYILPIKFYFSFILIPNSTLSMKSNLCWISLKIDCLIMIIM